MAKKIVGKKPTEKAKTSSTVKKQVDREEEQESTGSAASAFDNAKAQGSVAPGKYEAVIEELVLQDADEKGQSVRIKYGIATAGDERNNKVAQWYKILEADESEGKGASFLKKDLAILGYPDVRFADLEDAFKEIVEKDLGVLVTVKQNGQFTNVYLSGLCEDQDVIDEYLDQRTF